MAEAVGCLGLTASIAQMIAIVSTTLSAVVSLQSDFNQTNRDSAELLEGLKGLHGAIDDYERAFKSMSEVVPGCSRKLIQECEQTKREISLLLEQLHPAIRKSIPDLLRKQFSSCLKTVKADDMVAIQGCVSLVREGSLVGNGHEPVLWRLQRLCVSKLSRHTGTKTIHIPDIIKSPSPSVLLASWLVMALAAAAYHEARPEREHRTAYLFGSAFVAIILGVVEQSSMDTIILTNAPWCLAIGMLLDMSVRGIHRAWCHKNAGKRLQHHTLDVKEDTQW